MTGFITKDSEVAVGSPLDEFSIPCTWSCHTKYADPETPAEWAVFLKPRPCGCARSDYLTLCAPCWRVYSDPTHPARCLNCGRVCLSIELIARAERIA